MQKKPPSKPNPVLTAQLLARRRSWARLKKHLLGPYSLLRNLQYEALAELTPFRGRSLDIGGGRINSYYKLLSFEGEVESVNIDPSVNPTHLLDLNEPLPFRSDTFDNFFSLNTFEHIKQDQVSIQEALRILKPGGFFCITVPFIYRVHASPFDFHRHTAQWWVEYLSAHGADLTKLQVEPLVWDRLTTAYSFFGSGKIGKAVGAMVGTIALLKDLLAAEKGDRLTDQPSNRRVAEYALGYFITGRKAL